MKHGKRILLIVCNLSMFLFFSGCWNYVEIEKLAIVSGLAFDKNGANYIITSEIVEVKGGKDSKITTRLITSEGPTLFDAARKTIKKAGKKLYISHAEIVIFSREIAEEGLIPALDWICRDAETRYTLRFLVSKEKTAKEILKLQPMTADVLSFELNDMIRAEKSLSYALDIEEWQFLNDLTSTGISATIPTVDLTADDNKPIPEITGTGIFKKDKLVGFLNGEETETMLFIKDKIKGGVLINKEHKDGSTTNIALEIFKNKTNLKPRFVNGKIIVDINTNTDVSIIENAGTENYIDEQGRTKLKRDSEEMLENKIKNLVKKVQEQYGSDIFGLGRAVKLSMPDLWKQNEQKWEQVYKDIDVEVHSTINIRNSALQSKPIIVGD